MAQYRLTDGDMIVRLADNAFIPNDPTNVDRQAYEAWCAAGNVPEPYVAPPAAVPASISDRQFFQQLANEGIATEAEALAAVKTGDIPAALAAIVSAMPQGEQFGAEMILSGATVFERAHPMTAAIGAAYGWSSEQIDAFFRAAALL